MLIAEQAEEGQSPYQKTGGSIDGTENGDHQEENAVPYIPPDRQISSAQGQVHIKIGDLSILNTVNA